MLLCHVKFVVPTQNGYGDNLFIELYRCPFVTSSSTHRKFLVALTMKEFPDIQHLGIKFDLTTTPTPTCAPMYYSSKSLDCSFD